MGGRVHEWAIELPDGPHVIRLRHGYWSGKRTITVDGAEVHRDQRLLDMGSCTEVSLGGKTGYVVVGAMWYGGFRYDLIWNGVSQATGRPVAAPRVTRPMTAEESWFDLLLHVAWLSAIPVWIKLIDGAGFSRLLPALALSGGILLAEIVLVLRLRSANGPLRVRVLGAFAVIVAAVVGSVAVAMVLGRQASP